jgi:sulfite reductase beta subunit-like hemoprotein
MYRYDQFDRTLLAERVAEFRGQVARRLAGELTEEESAAAADERRLPQLHAYMLRISIPYGTLSSQQLRTLAQVARSYDRGYGHFTTRQNIQFNWIKLEQLPTPWRCSRAPACTACRPVATAPATSPPTSGPPSPPTRLKTRGCGPRFCAST